MSPTYAKAATPQTLAQEVPTFHVATIGKSEKLPVPGIEPGTYRLRGCALPTTVFGQWGGPKYVSMTEVVKIGYDWD